MSNVAIRVENLGKMYRIGGRREKYRTLRDAVTTGLVAPFRRAGQLLKGEAYGASNLKEIFWALKDVSFEIKHGDVVGVIGRNGAGKSTLLKILSRITEPTKGYADIYGRVGALLEVGTGFHEELTGRENIYLNSAILGMSRIEIDHKFDEIVDFAGVEKFIDTPVKFYSSGMKLRLGFAVAAHLEPEILVVDEVLAVGDAEFQKKCLGKMNAVASEGRTVLFVSHNMAAISGLCQRGILFQSGQLSCDTDVNTAVQAYFKESSVKVTTDRITSGDVYYKQVELVDDAPIAGGEVIKVKTKIFSSKTERMVLSWHIKDEMGYPVAIGHELSQYGTETKLLEGDNEILFKLGPLMLAEGTYSISFMADRPSDATVDRYEDCATFQVYQCNFSGYGYSIRTQWHRGSNVVPFKHEILV